MADGFSFSDGASCSVSLLERYIAFLRFVHTNHCGEPPHARYKYMLFTPDFGPFQSSSFYFILIFCRSISTQSSQSHNHNNSNASSMSTVTFFLGYSNRPIHQTCLGSSKSKPKVSVVEIESDMSDDCYTTDEDDEDVLLCSDRYADVDADEQNYYYYHNDSPRTGELATSIPRSKISIDSTSISTCSSMTLSPTFSSECASLTDTIGSLTTISSTATAKHSDTPLIDGATLARHDQILSHLNLELHDTVTEMFKPGVDTERFGLLEIEYESVEQLLHSVYPWLTKDTQEYAWHYGRLCRNRKKLIMLRDALCSYKNTPETYDSETQMCYY